MFVETDDQKTADSLKAATLYYQNNWGQGEIATEMNISRATVSRLLQYARKTGLVKIEIAAPMAPVATLTAQLQEKYQLAHLLVVPTQGTGTPDLLSRVGKVAAEYIESIVTTDDIIGLGWGKTIHQVANHLDPKDVSGITVVQMKGSVANTQSNNFAFESVNTFANAFHTLPQYLPLPVIFDHQQTKELVEQDTHIKHIIELGKKADIAVFTVGTVRDSALLFKLGYFTQAEQAYLQDHAVGDVFSRFINAHGQLVDTNIDQRTIGIPLDALANIPHSVLVAANPAKVPAVHGAVTAGYANTLIIDQGSATQLLNYDPVH
ncbi:sugar-binding transcriptional regulator [Furfurilactobacillus milii]|uniref:RNA polymerase subunit sigma-70 n=1 Tax=Furfurilactobacillus rossiae TaxID=231049 RepID=A0A7C9MML8_9LACO|nr:sugar-binding transcriptional regulator [Furfurilactobacillus milii]MYV04584.1 RNA polymerase subunit sigma-70 [Furfurilactobacillus milii]